MADKIKKPPGRPSSKSKRIIPFRGIVSSPEYQEDDDSYSSHMELLYSNPTIFKKIFKLYKQYNCEYVDIRFDYEHVYIIAKDHLCKNIIYTTFNCDTMNRYYCREPYDIRMQVPDIVRIMNVISAQHVYILFQSIVYNKNESMKITIKDDKSSMVDTYILPLFPTGESPYGHINKLYDDIETYPIKFNMPHTSWKNIIKTVTNISEVIRFEKIGEDPLKVYGTLSNGQTYMSSYLSDEGKNKLICELDEDYPFNIGIKVKHIKPQSSSLLSDEVRINMNVDKPMVCTSYIDMDTKATKYGKQKIYGTHRAEVNVFSCIEGNEMNEELIELLS